MEREKRKGFIALKRTKGADIKINDKPNGKSLMKWDFLSHILGSLYEKKMAVNLILFAAEANQTRYIISLINFNLISLCIFLKPNNENGDESRL